MANTIISATGKLKEFPFFADLPVSEFDRLSQSCRRKTYQSHELIIGYKDESSDVIFLLSGRARIGIYSRDGKRVSFGEISSGEIFGEISALDGQPRSVGVECLEPCSVAILSKQLFVQALADYPNFNLAVMRHLAKLTRMLTDRVFEFGALAVRGRLMAELIRIAELAPDSDDGLILSPAPTHEEIASRIGTHREAVTRELSRLEQRGLIVRRGRSLQVSDFPQLRRLAGEYLED